MGSARDTYYRVREGDAPLKRSSTIAPFSVFFSILFASRSTPHALCLQRRGVECPHLCTYTKMPHFMHCGSDSANADGGHVCTVLSLARPALLLLWLRVSSPPLLTSTFKSSLHLSEISGTNKADQTGHRSSPRFGWKARSHSLAARKCSPGCLW